MTRTQPSAHPAPLFQDVLRRLAAGDSAAAALLPRLEDYPAYAAGWLALAEALNGRNQKSAALLAFRRAAQGEGAAAVLHRAGQGLATLGDAAAGEAAFRRALAAGAGFAPAWYSLGLVLQDKGDFASAAAAFGRAHALKPGFHEAAFNQAVALQETGDLEAALGAYGTAYRLRPESLARIAQALVSAPQGALWLRPSALRAVLEARAA